MQLMNKIALFLLMTFVSFGSLPAKATSWMYENMSLFSEEKSRTPLHSQEQMTHQIINETSRRFRFELVFGKCCIKDLTGDPDEQVEVDQEWKIKSKGVIWYFAPEAKEKYIGVTLFRGRSILLQENQDTVKIFNRQWPDKPYFKVKWKKSYPFNNNTQQRPKRLLHMEFSMGLLEENKVEIRSGPQPTVIEARPIFQPYEYEPLHGVEERIIKRKAVINLLAPVPSHSTAFRPLQTSPHKNTKPQNPPVSFIYKSKSQVNPTLNPSLKLTQEQAI